VRAPMTQQVFDACVVIPHYAGRQLLECLEALYACEDMAASILVVDDAGPGDAIAEAQSAYPGIHVLRNSSNLGFVGACNRGLTYALEHNHEFAVLLNDDAMVDPGWLRELIAALSADTSIAACQPKILSARNPAQFDYSGAAGGMIDRYAYPWALGRWFEHVESDLGQYDTPREIFWASGAASCYRVEVLRRIGLLEPVLKMHMEEIDWCWRAWLAGYRVVSVPSARVRHYGAVTLTTDRFRKIFLNHRNSMIMLLKNYSSATLACTLPVRLMLEAITVAGALITGKFKRAFGAAAGVLGLIPVLPEVIRARRRVQSLRQRSDAHVMRQMFPGSIALRYLLGRSAPEPHDLPKGRR